MKLVSGNQQWLQAAAFYLRYQVFVLEQGIAAEDEFDTLDESEEILYLVYFDGSLPIATLRYQKLDTQTLNPDRFCVSKAYRKNGIGKKLLLIAEEKAQEEGCTRAVLSAELTATTFYEKLGYTVSSSPYEEDGILCVKMEKKWC
ncbi:GCN5 family acetyltransferase [Enterococcus sp. JM4C]|uniref:GNAT family N-acetyltransferase n=1 Tax=Candidatus Enterococcus huntleyi TaxID=1857217 RepID=UPI00137974A4|nr:GNAT family N-acetyltransferase [Enterococcus sp. JM4C]KAF1296047.1 GCN5 family acetyltransferase [Enterococcus sp. JM4C]